MALNLGKTITELKGTMPVAEQNLWRRFGIQYKVINPFRRADFQSAFVARAMIGGKLDDHMLPVGRQKTVTATDVNKEIADAIKTLMLTTGGRIRQERKYVDVKG